MVGFCDGGLSRDMHRGFVAPFSLLLRCSLHAKTRTVSDTIFNGIPAERAVRQ